MLKRTGIRRGSTPLTRTCRLDRSRGWSVARRSVKLRRTSKSREEQQALLALPKRSGGVCEIQAPGYCWGLATLPSHRRRRTQSTKAEKWCLTNVLHGCSGCEQLLTDHGANPVIRSLGWTIPAYPRRHPGSVPVLRCGVSSWLYPDGSVKPVDPDDRLRRIPDLSALGGAA